MKILKVIWQGIKFLGLWFIKSSKNPASISLTLKSATPLLILMGIDSALIDNASNGIIESIVRIGELITGGMTAYGVARKVAISLYQIIKIIISKFSK